MNPRRPDYRPDQPDRTAHDAANTLLEGLPDRDYHDGFLEGACAMAALFVLAFMVGVAVMGR